MNPAELLPLWDVVGNVIVASNGALFHCAEVTGHDPDCTTDDEWASVYDGLSRGFRKVPVNTLCQFILDRSAAAPFNLVSELDATNDGVAEVLQYQRERRASFLAMRSLRQYRTYFVYGKAVGLHRSEFRKVSPSLHEKRVKELHDIDQRICTIMQRGGLRLRKLERDEILRLLARQTRPDRNCIALKSGPVHPPLSLREQLVGTDAQWTDDYLKLGAQYIKVLAVKALPDQTAGGRDSVWFKLFQEGAGELPLPFDHRICINTRVPPRGLITLLHQVGSRLANSAVGSEAVSADRAKDSQAVANKRDMEEVGDKLVEGERLVHVGIQVVVWAATLAEVEQRASAVRNVFDNMDMEIYEESMAHHRAYFQSIAGMASGFDRWRLVTSSVASDLIPTTRLSSGDTNPTVVLERTATREPFGIAVRDTRNAAGHKARPNDNFLIFGGSGSGKSVFVNMLLAYGILSGPTKGRIVAVDYAGPEKSSFLTAAEVFDGKYIAISGGGEKINPLPAPHEAAPSGRGISPESLARVLQITNIILHNDEPGKESALYTGILQRCFKSLYDTWSSTTAPIYSDLFEVLKAYKPEERDEEARHRTLLGLMRKFLEGAEATLLNHQTTASRDGDFLIYDLFGLKTYEPHIRSAVGAVVTHWARSLSFDGRPDILKYVLFDEAAELFSVGLEATILEMQRTARAHGTAIGIITQDYEKFRACGIAGTFINNSAAHYFLSHRKAANAIADIVRDFGMNAREAEVFRSVDSVPGMYSEIFVQSTALTESGEAERLGAKARLYLSPFDEQLVTTAPEDRRAERAIRVQFPNAPRVEVLAYLEQEKRKRVAS